MTVQERMQLRNEFVEILYLYKSKQVHKILRTIDQQKHFNNLMLNNIDLQRLTGIAQATISTLTIKLVKLQILTIKKIGSNKYFSKNISGLTITDKLQEFILNLPLESIYDIEND